MDFTPDERSMISYFAQHESPMHRWGFYFATLTPIFAFAGYGLLRQDLVALGMAFFALFGFLLWHLSASRRYAPLLTSICRKLEHAQSDPATGA